MRDPEFLTADHGGVTRARLRNVELPGPVLGALCALGDALLSLLIIISVNAGYHLIHGDRLRVTPDVIAAGLLISVLFAALQAVQGGYAPRFYLDTKRSVKRAVVSWCAVFFIAAWAAFLLKNTSDFSRLSFTVAFAVGLVAVAAVRIGVVRLMSEALDRNRLVLRRAYLIYAEGMEPEGLLREARRDGLRMVGIRALPSAGDDDGSLARTCADAVEAVRGALQGGRLDEVYLFIPWDRRLLLQRVVRALDQVPVRVLLLSDPGVEFLNLREPPLGGLAAFEVQRSPLSPRELLLKRSLDLLVATGALILCLPLLALVCGALLLESGRPVIFRQRRKGFGGRPFTIYKLRTMRVMEDGDVIVQASRADPRVTRLGAVLRRTSIDELPQLWNVVKGDMSIVGPRPHALAHDTYYDKLIADYAYRHHVKPGLTGWAQVNGLRGETNTLAAMAERVRHDRWYINNWTIWLDVQVIVRTAFLVLFQRQAY